MNKEFVSIEISYNLFTPQFFFWHELSVEAPNPNSSWVSPCFLALGWNKLNSIFQNVCFFQKEFQLTTQIFFDHPIFFNLSPLAPSKSQQWNYE